jgi:predicted nucleotidyltransferase
MKLPPDFRDLLEEFASAGVEFLVVGGYAFAFHARPRATKDLDLLIEGSADNRARAAGALERYGAPQNAVAAVRTLSENEVAYLGQPPLRVDILRAIDGVDLTKVFRDGVSADWDGVSVRIIALEDLLQNKRAAGRPQDIADATILERIIQKKS